VYYNVVNSIVIRQPTLLTWHMRLTLVFLLLLTSAALHAQVRPSRTWYVDMARRAAPAGPMPSMLGGAEMYRSYGSTYDEQAWQLRLHAVAEPYRFTDSTSNVQITTSLEFHHELTANPRNDISFNPRTARWEEYALVHVATSDWSVRGGWLHRCKHDLDNLDGPNEDAPAAGPIAQRTIILTGPTAGVNTAPFTTPLGTVMLATGAEWYVVSEDYRRPSTSHTGSWKDLQGAVWFRAEGRWPLAAHVDLRASYWLSLPWFASRHGAPSDIVVPHDARAEVMLSVARAARIDLVLSAEHIFDELSYLDARPSTYWQFGIRFAP
jgi:hypothetical protein